MGAISPIGFIVVRIRSRHLEKALGIRPGRNSSQLEENHHVNQRGVLQRFGLVLGLISLVLAVWSGMHIQHLLDDGGSRHAGETLVAIILTLLVFAGCW